MYLDARRHEVSQRTLDGYHYRLKRFIRWCQSVEGIDDLNDLTGRKLQKYRTWRRDAGDLEPISLRGQLDALRIFIRWCGSIDAVERDLHGRFEALMPSPDRNDERSESVLATEEAGAPIESRRKFEYASRPHVIVELLRHTGIRLGALHSLDVDDYDGNAERIGLTPPA
jgi:site-specific recombinase XerD